MRFFGKILFAITIAVTLGDKPVIDLLVYDTLVAVVEENEEEVETIHKDAIKEWKYVRKALSFEDPLQEEDEVVHNYSMDVLTSLFKGSVSPQPPEII